MFQASRTPHLAWGNPSCHGGICPSISLLVHKGRGTLGHSILAARDGRTKGHSLLTSACMVASITWGVPWRWNSSCHFNCQLETSSGDATGAVRACSAIIVESGLSLLCPRGKTYKRLP